MRPGLLRGTRRLLLPEPFFGSDGVSQPHQAFEELTKPAVAARDRLRIGWVGLSDMGMGMVWKLVKEPEHAVHVWTRNERKLRAYKEYVEGKLNRHLQERPVLLDLPRFADVIVVSLGNIRAVREVLLERDDAVLFHARPGTVIIDHSTVDLGTTAECASVAEARGLHFLDAPVAGSPDLAASGNLTVMVGGDQQAFQRSLRVLSKYSVCVEYMGPSGSGTKTKMVNETLSSMHAVASAEAAVLAKSLGIRDLRKLTKVVDSSLAGSNMFKRNAAFWPEQFTTRTKIGTAQSVARAVRNLAILKRYTDEVPGLADSMPCTAAASTVLQRCGEAQGHDADITSAVHFLNPDKPNTRIHWDVPVADPVRNHILKAKLDNAGGDEEPEEKWDSINEFDPAPSAVEAWEPPPGGVPRVDPAKLEELYSKAHPKGGVSRDLSNRLVPRTTWDPVTGGSHGKDVRVTMDRFVEVGKNMDAAMGKSSIGGVPFHHRPPGLMNPVREGLGDALTDPPPPAGSAKTA